MSTYPYLVARVSQSQYWVYGTSFYNSFGPSGVWHNSFPSTNADVAPLSYWP
ncbi:hypothetical protein [Frankia sp. QA3]|uniref:hypothetical protein n=1 Tax=Frankia sp. QA3 TaxID=710111 RepID=UPI000269BFA3|nr:hypothetical protein [Frankia sp. QA3]EIV91524.1 hypothetical protein FraQA3DRAFT_0981 [Frankia sp. QA3]